MRASRLANRAIEELNLWDARMWTRGDPAMLKWQLEIKQRGLLTAIVSNMGDAVLAHMERELEWLNRFDVLVWSYQLRIASLIRPSIATRSESSARGQRRRFSSTTGRIM